MNLEYVSAALSLVKAVNVLRHQCKSPYAPFEFRQCEMRGIRLSGFDQAAPPVVPLPDENRITGESVRSRQILRAKLLPQTGGAAKCRNTALSRNASAG